MMGGRTGLSARPRSAQIGTKIAQINPGCMHFRAVLKTLAPRWWNAKVATGADRASGLSRWRAHGQELQPSGLMRPLDMWNLTGRVYQNIPILLTFPTRSAA